MRLNYCLVPLFLTACIPTQSKDLIGESDRPGPQDTALGIDSAVVDTSVDNEVGNGGMPPEELVVDADSLVVTAANDPAEPGSPLVLSVDANKILHVVHIFEWDSSTITAIQVTQPEPYALDFDYGSSGETSIWLTVQFSIDISTLEDGTYSVTVEGDRGEFVLE